MAAENVMGVVSELGASVTDSLAYLGALAMLGTRAAYYTFVGTVPGQAVTSAKGRFRRPWKWASGRCRFFP